MTYYHNIAKITSKCYKILTKSPHCLQNNCGLQNRLIKVNKTLGGRLQKDFLVNKIIFFFGFVNFSKNNFGFVNFILVL